MSRDALAGLVGAVFGLALRARSTPATWPAPYDLVARVGAACSPSPVVVVAALARRRHGRAAPAGPGRRSASTAGGGGRGGRRPGRRFNLLTRSGPRPGRATCSPGWCFVVGVHFLPFALAVPCARSSSPSRRCPRSMLVARRRHRPRCSAEPTGAGGLARGGVGAGFLLLGVRRAAGVARRQVALRRPGALGCADPRLVGLLVGELLLALPLGLDAAQVVVDLVLEARGVPAELGAPSARRPVGRR